MDNILSNTSNAELKEWQTQLEQLRLENNKLKNLLAKAISKEVSASFVEAAEAYQQKFIDKDQVVDLIRHELASLISAADSNALSEQSRQYVKLKMDIQRFVKEYNQLKSSFLKHLAIVAK